MFASGGGFPSQSAVLPSFLHLAGVCMWCVSLADYLPPLPTSVCFLFPRRLPGFFIPRGFAPGQSDFLLPSGLLLVFLFRWDLALRWVVLLVQGDLSLGVLSVTDL